MLYIEKTLLPEEKILYSTKPHWMIFYPMIIWLAISLLFFIMNSSFFGSLLLIISIFSFINSVINYYCSEYVITNKRIVMKVGFIRRRSLEIFLDRVEGIYVEQSILGRLLGFGTIFVGGIGGTKTPFLYIPNPIEFRNNVQKTQVMSKR
jgi:uncharacterized membrane protein YdbT with pleckstrin-like domain